jgi:transmembrane sensor
MDGGSVMPIRRNIIEDLILAEASAWLARLQGSERTHAAEEAFRTWLAESPAHAQAFARVTEAWDVIPGAVLFAAKPSSPSVRSRSGPLFLLTASIMLVILIACSAWWALRDPVYQTAVGEQRTVVLSDGSRLVLNTDTHLTVAYRENERRLLIDHGEVMVEVAPNPQRPLVAQVGSKEVKALGTAFDTRGDASHLTVILFKGSVEIGDRTSHGASDTITKPILLSPGERLTINTDKAAILDRPNIEQFTAWQHGKVIFDGTTLAEAVSEFNRYTTIPIRLESTNLGTLRISGVFSIREPAEFANVIARLEGLHIERGDQSIVLKR